ncbi:hypothetical protein QGN29_08575 [Temperatibacter marinus]|uniref:Symporter n=1 Tax=Temperatibacter marinus TaxID=1456591 RepID=A0AA52H9G7_9PROT|nr:hypothetical protein [Temperatibacter marinus]WND01613.1 hypothetical protein QGN29_08575 [Temperatibacter marinus]
MFDFDMEAIDRVVISMDSTMQGILAAILIFMMFSVALGLRGSHFTRIVQAPGDVVSGLLVQVIGLPAVTMAFIHLLQLPASIALGLIIVASCPGGNVSNFFARISHANVAYSITLTALSGIFAVLMIPISVLFWGGLYEPIDLLLKEIDLDRGLFFIRIFAMLGFPLFVGMMIAHKHPDFADRLQKKAVPLSVVLLGVLIVITVSQNSDLLFSFGPSILSVVVLHNIVAFALGGIAAALLMKERGKFRTLIFEVGLQNTGLALVILLSEFQGLGGAALITATWGIWHMVTGFGLAGLFRLQDKKHD